MGKKKDKQFPLTSKENCIVYLNRIISSLYCQVIFPLKLRIFQVSISDE